MILDRDHFTSIACLIDYDWQLPIVIMEAMLPFYLIVRLKYYVYLVQ